MSRGSGHGACILRKIMPIASLRWRFDAEVLRDVPEAPGVCTL